MKYFKMFNEMAMSKVDLDKSNIYVSKNKKFNDRLRNYSPETFSDDINIIRDKVKALSYTDIIVKYTPIKELISISLKDSELQFLID